MAVDPRSQFQHWYPQLRGYFSTLVASSCAPQYANYTSTSTEDACVKVISCILESTPEAVKINMASAGLLLGLLPALLGLLGSSTIETSCLAARRPVLSLLLSLGSPAVNPIRIYDYRDIVEKIINLNETVSLPTIPRGLLLRKATLILTYGLTLAAIANTTSVNLDLGQKTVWNNSCRYSVFPLLYGIIAVGVHVLGLMAFSQRLHILPAEGVKVSWGASALLRRLKHEFTHEAEAGKLDMELRKGNLKFVLLSGLTTLITLLHIMWGVYVFSGLLFIGTTDAIRVMGRYIASVIVCRGVLLHELACVKETFGLNLIVDEDESLNRT